MPTRIRTVALLACFALFTGCGAADDEDVQAAVIRGISGFLPTVPLSSTEPSSFLVLGTGFPSASGLVTVRFEVAGGTPFLGGTSASLEADGIAENGTQIRGTAPAAMIPHTLPGPFMATVTAVFANGPTYASASGIALFASSPPPPPPTVTGMRPGLLVSGTAKCFTLQGTLFDPIGGTAMVTFEAASGTPFSGSATLSVPATIDSSTEASGTIPAEAVTEFAQAVATIVLPDGNTGASFAAVATFDTERKINALDAEGFDFFGTDVAIDGDTAVVGARREDETAGTAGAAYIFQRVGTNWVQQQKLLAADGLAGDEFGTAVAISGNTIAVGSPLHDSAASNAGAIYVYVRSGAAWTLQQKLTATDAASADHLGESVAIDGETIAAGAPDENNAGGTDAGSVYVFSRSGATWTQQQKVTSPTSAASDHYGQSVAIRGSDLLVGAPGGDAALLYRLASGGWGNEEALTAPGTSAGDAYGTSVALDGDRAVVGAPSADGAVAGSGNASVFVRMSPMWLHEQTLMAAGGSAGDDFGEAVAIDGDDIVVGAPDADVAATNAGAVFAYRRTGSTWTAAPDPFTASDAASSDGFGERVALASCSLLVSARLDNDGGTDAGSAYFK